MKNARIEFTPAELLLVYATMAKTNVIDNNNVINTERGRISRRNAIKEYDKDIKNSKDVGFDAYKKLLKAMDRIDPIK
jgi:hypothetical protein